MTRIVASPSLVGFLTFGSRKPGISDETTKKDAVLFASEQLRVPLNVMLMCRDEKISQTFVVLQLPTQVTSLVTSFSSGGFCAGVKNVTKAKWSKLSGVVAVG